MQQNTWVEKGEYCGSKWAYLVRVTNALAMIPRFWFRVKREDALVCVGKHALGTSAYAQAQAWAST